MATAHRAGPGRQIESNTPAVRGLQLSKITKKNNHVPYNMRCWKCCPPSSIHFRHLLGNMHLHGLIKFQKYSLFHAWYLLSIFLMCGGSLHTLYFSSVPIDKNRKPPHIRRILLKASIRREIDCISEIELICVISHFLKRCQKCVDDGRHHFQHLMFISAWLVFFEMLLNFRPLCCGGTAFDLPVGIWDISGCHRQPPCCGRHLSERYCITHELD